MVGPVVGIGWRGVLFDEQRVTCFQEEVVGVDSGVGCKLCDYTERHWLCSHREHSNLHGMCILL